MNSTPAFRTAGPARLAAWTLVLLLASALTLAPASALELDPAPAGNCYAADDELAVAIDKQPVYFPDQAPYLASNGSLMVPLRFVAFELGARADFDPARGLVSVQKDTLYAAMTLGSTSAIVDGKGWQLPAPAEITGGRVCLPLRFLAELLGCPVSWNQEARRAELTSPSSIQASPSDSEILTSFPDLGANADLNGYRLFPADNPWNQPISHLPVDPNSELILQRIGLDRGLKADFGSNWDGGPFGIPYIVVDGSTPRVPMRFDYADESDPGPYPIPADAPVEKGSDRHILVLDRDNEMLFETWNTWPRGDGFWAGSGAVFDLRSNALRPTYWTSADAAGLPILPGLVRYQEVMETGHIDHALRVTVDETRRAFVAPATHFASSNEDPLLPPMGARIRLKSDYDTSGFPPCAQVILEALKTYGMFVADNGSSFFISGAPDERWNDEELAALRQVTASDLELVQMENIITDY